MKPENIRADNNSSLRPKLLKPEPSAQNILRQDAPEILSISMDPDFVLMQKNSMNCPSAKDLEVLHFSV
ncbi:MAG: hypothetical protein PHF18_07340 [Methanosarcina sp.]|uniref:hypothetical protein n=1 Tax=Methanosarcina sp. TaxID=2213 RepID=UPI0026046AC0|nr:hypothetical protein [Methanosarcina sp.]MDD3246647.1 hypothetical protein [Methanosarcina sp.]MDD4247771.1 hypothetical protein [Methanosarcina sp.]